MYYRDKLKNSVSNFVDARDDDDDDEMAWRRRVKMSIVINVQWASINIVLMQDTESYGHYVNAHYSNVLLSVQCMHSAGADYWDGIVAHVTS